MKLRKITLAVLLLTLINFGCNEEEETESYPERDETEVYNEDIAEIEEFLATHTYNYEDFDFNNPYSLANDTFKVVIDTIDEDNSDAIPLIDRPELELKTVEQNGIQYDLYVLKVREGLGNVVHPLDRAAVTYKGALLDGTVFDQQINVASPFYLTDAGSGGVVTGFRESIIEFRTRDSYTENSDNSVINHNHGIGAVFIPSGLGYFSVYVSSIEPYSPLVFSFEVLTRLETDYDNDHIPSYLEDLDGDGDGYNDDTDGDGVANFIDTDDDGDGILTEDEVEPMQYDEDGSMNPFTTKAEAQAYYDANAADNEIFVKIEYLMTGNYRLHTTILTDSNDDGIPDYLDPSM